MSFLWSPETPFPATSSTPGCRLRTVASDWWAAAIHLDTTTVFFSSFFPLFYNLHIHQMAHEYWWAGCRRSGCPVAAGHCGKFAASLIVIRRPSSVSIKIRRNDTFGGTCSCEYVCMKRWREIEGEEEERMCFSTCVRVRVRVRVRTHPGPQDHTVTMVTPTIRAHEAKALDLRESGVMEWGRETKWVTETRWIYPSVYPSVYLSIHLWFFLYR